MLTSACMCKCMHVPLLPKSLPFHAEIEQCSSSLPDKVIRRVSEQILPDDRHHAHSPRIEAVAHRCVRKPMSENTRSGSAAWATMESTMIATAYRGDVLFEPVEAMSSAFTRRHQLKGVSVGWYACRSGEEG